MGNRRGRPQSPAGVPAGPVLPTGWEWGGEVPAAQPVTAAGRACGTSRLVFGVRAGGSQGAGGIRLPLARAVAGAATIRPPASGLPCPGVRLFSS